MGREIDRERGLSLFFFSIFSFQINFLNKKSFFNDFNF